MYPARDLLRVQRSTFEEYYCVELGSKGQRSEIRIGNPMNGLNDSRVKWNSCVFIARNTKIPNLDQSERSSRIWDCDGFPPRFK